VLLVNFSDNAVQPYTTDYARSVVFTATFNFDLALDSNRGRDGSCEPPPASTS
jgi:hypothetical protein